jgi:hypothetical protein
LVFWREVKSTPVSTKVILPCFMWGFPVKIHGKR